MTELANCSNCKYWRYIGKTDDDRSECMKEPGRTVWESSDNEDPFSVKIRTTETMCCDLYDPKEGRDYAVLFKSRRKSNGT